MNNFTPSLQCPLVSSEKGMNIIILNDLLEYYHLDWSSCHAISLAERVLIVCMKISCVWLLTVCFIEIVVRRHQHQYCIVLCLDLLCNRKWEEYDCQSLIPRENYLYPVFFKFPSTYCGIEYVLPVVKCTSFLPLHRKVYIFFWPFTNPAAANDFPTSSFCWICLCLESCCGLTSMKTS